MLISFQTPFLVQRLHKPYEERSSFEEGIIVKKGLVEEVGEVFEHIMGFDYMGSAEFEWGALPKSLDYAIRYARDGDYIACEIDVVSSHYVIKPVFYICHKDIEEPVAAWIKKAAMEKHPRCKEYLSLQNVIDGRYDNELRSFAICGWYDLQNRFWFFTDRKMFLNVKKMFGVK